MSSNTPVVEPTTPMVEPPAMSFLDHLDELRRRLTYSAMAVAIAFVVCFNFSDRIYAFLGKPVSMALKQAREYQIKNNVTPISQLEEMPDKSQFTYVFNAEASMQGVTIPAGTTMPARLEKQENGNRAVVAASRIVVGKSVIPEGFRLPLEEIGNITTNQDDMLVVHTLQGGFNHYIKVAFYAALALSVPFLLIQVWGFISPGLYEHEKRGVVPFVSMATICFATGAAFAYYVAFPRAVTFLLSVSVNFRPMIEVNEYFDLIITIILGLGLVFEIPAIVYFFAKLGLLTAGFMMRFWRHAMVAIFIIAAILSPTTDIPNMMVFAVPMAALYFFSVGIAWAVAKPRPESA
jgi:sec-independent protein translocase protein TatC